ncbi:DUF4179 domain-containing protein [Brevibacillus choshinensis]|uniref:DUF4179 domain-containing protein n=1 Tax=Brevibacillus choshinensis TaxID=54911 RepID=UPI002E1D417A|nr:DUF4179 domain-containing protein [Brevibacillus choshinensis]
MQEDQSFKQLEKELWNEKERMENITVPESIDRYIRNGMQLAKQRRIRHRHRTLARWGSAMAVGILMMGLFFSIRLSPAVAAYVSHLPGMEKLVELIRDDKGLQMAAKHDLVQTIGASAAHDGVSFTVDQVLMDQKRMVVFYTIRHEQDGHSVDLENVSFSDKNGSDWVAGYSWSSSGDSVPTSIEQNRLDIFWENTPNVPDTLTAKVTLSVDQKKLETPFQVTFPINKTKYETLKESVYPVNQDVTIDGQRFTVSQIVVYPTQTEVSIQFDPANTKHIFDFDRLRLEDEKGRTYAFWGNGIPSMKDGENKVTYNLESNYFEHPEKLVLKADGIRALDKNKLQVVIDGKQGTLIKAPDSRLQLTALRQNEDVVGMDFLLQVEKQDENRFSSFGYELTDDRGNQYEHVSGSSSSGDPSDIKSSQRYGSLYKRTTAKGTPDTYTFTLTDYPSRLSDGFTLQIK